MHPLGCMHGPLTKENPMTDFEWQEECRYIQGATDALLSKGARCPQMSSFNYDRACFTRYLVMQRDSATREGFHDSAQYIQHCLDDIHPDN